MSLLKKMIKDHKRMNAKTKTLTEQRTYDRTSTSWIELKELKKLKLQAKDKINAVKQKLHT